MEGAGRIGELAQAIGLAVTIHPLFEGSPVPTAIPAGDALVVMGGSMGVGDIGDARWPFLAAEVELMARQVRSEAPVLGVCLGAQLLASALGAKVYPLRVGDPPAIHREVGWGAVTFVAPAGTQPSLAGLNEAEVVLHWHGDTFDLPSGATLLASTLACPNQMFRFGPRAYGLQFHVELTPPDVPVWVRDDAAFVRAANGPGGGARILADTALFMPRFRQVGERMIRNLLTSMFDPR
jgi:GMP synthase-like glutamine amidotransferase